MTKVFQYKDISSIQFGILSAEEIVERSVCRVDNSKFNGANSVYDLRMGSMEQDDKCITCQLIPKECPGHSGHISLNTFILHPMYLRQITNFLKCLCIKCYRIVLSEDHLNLDGILRYQTESRFEKIVDKLEKIDSCYFCKSPKPKISFQQKTNDISMRFKEKKIVLKENEIKNIFDNMNNDDIRILGFNSKYMHPKNLVLSVIPVIPPRARPYVMADTITCDDDITTQYVEIIKANRNLIDENMNESRKYKIIQTLNFRIKTLMNNSQGKARHTNGRPLKGIKERLSGKDGLIRSNLMGKRRNQSGRSVISADPTLRTDELVVPEKIAKNLTMPETVNTFNKEYLQKLIDNGKANFVIKDDGKTKINLNYAMLKKGTSLLWGDKILRNGKEIIPFSQEFKQIKKKFQLIKGDIIIRNGEQIKDIELPKIKPFNIEIGDIVERQLKNGDIILFNRQPTLHRGSMLAKRIIIRDNKTFRFNLASTKSFNADFDGDEMNVFLPQDPDARAELLNLSTTMHNIMSSQSTKNIICITQDALLSSYLLTKDNMDLGRDRFFDICMKGDGWTPSYILDRLEWNQKIAKKIGYDLPLYCGKNLFSLMLPKNFNYTKKNDARKDEPIVKIIKGVLLEGAINKSQLGQGHNTIIHVLHKEYGMEKAIDFLNNVQFIGNQYLIHRSYTIGIQDCLIKEHNKFEDIIYKCFIEAKHTETNISHEKIRELKIGSILDKARDMSMKIVKNCLEDNNGFVGTVLAGSKGELFNIVQINSLLGQQNHMGERIRPVFNNEKRTLPHYPLENQTVEQEYESRGFIKSSFLRGLNPQEFIFHSMAGREGISQTSMNTSSSGYTQRKMVKVMEDIQIKYDGTVRNTNNWVFQWGYGGDGFDRSECSFNPKNNNVFFIDVNQVASRLNNDYEIENNLI